MRIISQDGTIDVNYDRVVIKLCISNNINAETETTKIHIGTYSTRARALEVMAEIREHDISYEQIKCFLSTGNNTILKLVDKLNDGRLLLFYQMPTDKGEQST